MCPSESVVLGCHAEAFDRLMAAPDFEFLFVGLLEQFVLARHTAKELAFLMILLVSPPFVLFRRRRI